MQMDRVLVFSQRNSTVWKCMSRDISHGFRKLGLDVQFCEELHKGAALVAENGMPFHWLETVKCQQEDPPQLIFNMGHLRAAYPHGMWNGDAAFVTWIQDWCDWTIGKNPDQKRLVDTFNASKDFIFYSFPALGEAILKQGFVKERVRFLPPGANFDLFYPAPAPEIEFTVGFTCNVGAPMTAQDPVRLKRRTEPVEWLLELGVKVKLWGMGWDKMPEFAPHWHGLVKNGPELRAAYHSVHAVLQSNSDTGFHQRSYEALASGRPVLRMRNADTTDLPYAFEFSDKAELESRVYEVKRVPIRGYRLIASEAHDYKKRCQDILNAMP